MGHLQTGGSVSASTGSVRLPRTPTAVQSDKLFHKVGLLLT